MKKFKKTYIEITNVCNLSCDFCPKTRRPAEFMKLSAFENILKQIKGHSEHIYFHVLGEPLLHPELKDFLRLSSDYGYIVNITTNGTLIDKAKDVLIKSEALRQINFSLHSFDANPINNPMESYLNNIITFAKEAREKSDIIIALRLWNLEESLLNAPDNKKTQIEKNRHILERLEEAFNLEYKIEEKLLPGRGIKLAPKVFLNQATKFNWPNTLHKDITEKGFCYGLRDQIAILVDGTVVPCCLDGEGVINLGNINNASFSEIIEGSRAKDIYEGFSKREVVEELCRKCDYRRRFSL